MAAYFIDLDGTVLRYHTSEWLPGAVEMLTALQKQGHSITFITMRCASRDAGTEWSLERTHIALATLPFAHNLITDVQSPRVLIDDTMPTAIHLQTNAEWLIHLPADEDSDEPGYGHAV